MAEKSAAAAADEERDRGAERGAERGDRGDERKAEDAPAPSAPRLPKIPPVLVRFSVIGGILVAMATGAILLVTEVIAPKVRGLGTPPAAEAGVAPGDPAKAAGKHKPEKPVPTEILTVSDLVVNPAGSGGRRYLKVAAAIELAAPKGKKGEKGEKRAEGAAGMSLEEVRVRDLLLRELSARSLEELTDPVTKEEMRQGIREGLNGILHERVINLYFTEYVVQ